MFEFDQRRTTQETLHIDVCMGWKVLFLIALHQKLKIFYSERDPKSPRSYQLHLKKEHRIFNQLGR